MKKRAKNCLIITPVIFLLAVFFSSCHEKGCTNPHALNYNSVADVDDGSCIICQSVQSDGGTAAADLIDFNFSSPHYNQTVARVFLRQIKDAYNNSACGDAQCNFYFKIQSLVNEDMDLPYHVSCSGSNIFFSFSQFETIFSLQTTGESIIPTTPSNPCSLISGAFISFSANGTITYH